MPENHVLVEPVRFSKAMTGAPTVETIVVGKVKAATLP